MKHLKREVFRLAGTYLIIIMVMSLGFSFIFYNASLRELDRRPHGFDAEMMLPMASGDTTTVRDYFAQRTQESRQALLLDLLLVNLAALVLGGLLSYLLAERTLQPIEENLEAQSQFVSDASHELRTPLTALLTANEVALRSKTLKLADAKQVIAENVADITRLQELANSMLGLLRDDETELFQDHVSLQTVVSESMNIVVSHALEKDIAVEDTVQKLTVRGNQQRLIQLVTIILDNAIKYSPAHASIYLTSERRGKLAVLTIRDEGIGMDEATVQRIFTRFYRAEQSRTTAGYGLGLSIAKKIVHAHGGKIDVKSQPEKGTAFTIFLPLTTA